MITPSSPTTGNSRAIRNRRPRSRNRTAGVLQRQGESPAKDRELRLPVLPVCRGEVWAESGEAQTAWARELTWAAFAAHLLVQIAVVAVGFIAGHAFEHVLHGGQADHVGIVALVDQRHPVQVQLVESGRRAWP